MTEQQVSEKVSQWEWEPGVPPLTRSAPTQKCTSPFDNLESRVY
jgi:hypothetical protein